MVQLAATIKTFQREKYNPSKQSTLLFINMVRGSKKSREIDCLSYL